MIMLDQWPDLRDYEIILGDCLLKMKEIPQRASIVFSPTLLMAWVLWGSLGRLCSRCRVGSGSSPSTEAGRASHRLWWNENIHRLTCAIEDADSRSEI